MSASRLLILGAPKRDGAIAALMAGAVLLGVAAVTLVSRADAPVGGAPAVPDDRAMCAGRWDVVAVESDGTPVDQELVARLHVIFQADGSWAVLLRRMPVAEGRSTNRQDESPKTFEMETLGSEGIKPSRYTGIYRLDGDSSVLCLVPAGKARPEEFSAPRHSGRTLVTLKRATEPSVGE